MAHGHSLELHVARQEDRQFTCAIAEQIVSDWQADNLTTRMQDRVDVAALMQAIAKVTRVTTMLVDTDKHAMIRTLIMALIRGGPKWAVWSRALFPVECACAVQTLAKSGLASAEMQRIRANLDARDMDDKQTVDDLMDAVMQQIACKVRWRLAGTTE